jgi:hypothetical protein
MPLSILAARPSNRLATFIIIGLCFLLIHNYYTLHKCTAVITPSLEHKLGAHKNETEPNMRIAIATFTTSEPSFEKLSLANKQGMLAYAYLSQPSPS